MREICPELEEFSALQHTFGSKVFRPYFRKKIQFFRPRFWRSGLDIPTQKQLSPPPPPQEKLQNAVQGSHSQEQVLFV